VPQGGQIAVVLDEAGEAAFGLERGDQPAAGVDVAQDLAVFLLVETADPEARDLAVDLLPEACTPGVELLVDNSSYSRYDLKCGLWGLYGTSG
jgi:hypothetical protein